jgi:Fe-S oxidoreductase
MEKDVQLEGVTGVRYMYHDPCRSPMKRYDALKVVNSLMNEAYNRRIETNDRCCGESGTLALTRPDVSAQVRFRKEEEMRAGTEKFPSPGRVQSSQGADLLHLAPSGPEALQRGRRS